MSKTMRKWKMKSVKVILKTADIPKQAVADPSNSLGHCTKPSPAGFNVNMSVNETRTDMIYSAT